MFLRFPVAFISISCLYRRHHFAMGGDPWNLQRDILRSSKQAAIQLDVYSPLEKSLDGGYCLDTWWSLATRIQEESADFTPSLRKAGRLSALIIAYSGEARFPAQIHDIKSGYKIPSAKAQGFGFRAKQVFIFGASAGGIFVALAGVTSGVENLEGFATDNRNNRLTSKESLASMAPAIRATILNQSTLHG